MKLSSKLIILPESIGAFNDWLWPSAKIIADECGVFPPQLFQGAVKKGAYLTPARIELMQMIRDRWHQVDKGFPNRVTYRTLTMAGDVPGAKPISTTTIGMIMGVDHSSVVKAIGGNANSSGV